MTDYEWLTSMNLCHKCRKEKPAPGKKFCFGCLDETREYNAKRYDSEKAKQYKKRRRELYEEHKAAGICVRCKNKATHGIYCYEHSVKEKRRRKNRTEQAKRIRHDRGLIPQYRIENGLCLTCGAKIEEVNLKRGCKVCMKHSVFFRECGKNGKSKSTWEEDNEIVFGKKSGSANRKI